jgi:hypothetical protein
MVDMGIDDSQFTWQNRAACRDVPSFVFYPDEILSLEEVDPAYAKISYRDFCDTCPVRYLCLEFAVLHDMVGIWGGTTENERKKRFCTGERYEMRNYKEECGSYQPLYGHS